MHAKQRRQVLLDIVFQMQYEEITIPEQAEEIAGALLRSNFSPSSVRQLMDALTAKLRPHM